MHIEFHILLRINVFMWGHTDRWFCSFSIRIVGFVVEIRTTHLLNSRQALYLWNSFYISQGAILTFASLYWEKPHKPLQWYRLWNWISIMFWSSDYGSATCFCLAVSVAHLEARGNFHWSVGSGEISRLFGGLSVSLFGCSLHISTRNECGLGSLCLRCGCRDWASQLSGVGTCMEMDRNMTRAVVAWRETLCRRVAWGDLEVTLLCALF
jgi:hypothetical protein